ncbi:diguanylate cyclase, partial [Acinetobacter baumannii]
FAIVLPNCTPERARLLGQALIDTLAVPMKINDYQVATGTSVGVAFGPKDAHDAAALMRAADLALYSAKRSGRGVVR